MTTSAAAITVRRAVLADAAAFARKMGEPEVLRQLMQVPYTSEEVWRARLADLLAPGKQDLMLVAEIPGDDGTPQVVASAGLHPASPALRRRHAMMMGISVAREAQGKGVGTALMQAVCDWADNWGQVLRLELTVYADNQRAIALYQRFGFRQEGVHRGYALRDGAYVDALSMARLHPNPPRIAPFDPA
jgi:putative acetyltransferase